MNGHWAEASTRVLRETFAALPSGLTEAELRRITRDAYPFGERSMHPYKVWNREAARWRAAYLAGRKAPLAPVRSKPKPKPPVPQPELF